MGSLEVSVNPQSRFRPGSEPIRRAEERASWTCAIENGAGGFGTGLLVNRDLVLTNYHVIADLLARPELYRQARCRFDFMEDVESGERHEGTWVGFAERWEGPWSQYSDKDDQGADTGFEPDRLDYAIIRLAEPIGDEPTASGSSRRTPRGWLALPSDPALPAAGSSISIWQHPVEPASLMTRPVVMPMQWDQGVVLGLLDGGLRVRHDVKTLKGSSGAACFDANLDLVALHHAGDPKVNRDNLGNWNQAVPMKAIIGHLKSVGHADLIGVVPPPPVRVIPVPAPVSRSLQAQDIIEKRVRAAAMLMDRDTDEDSVAWARDKQNGSPGIVHVLACRHIDSHRNFLERLVRLCLAAQDEGMDARRRRVAAFLNVPTHAVSAEAWQRETISWQPAQVPADRALALMKRDLTAIAASGRNIMVDIAVDVASANLSREKKLVPALAQYCSTIATADQLQIFIVYYDRAASPDSDPTRERRKELARMWSPQKRPPGCGVCLQLGDVDSVELESWCRSVQAIWQGEEGQLIGEIEPLFSTGRLPMLTAEQRVSPIVRQHIEALS